jgi:predicted benzoate:H+ symporter BenE
MATPGLVLGGKSCGGVRAAVAVGSLIVDLAEVHLHRKYRSSRHPIDRAIDEWPSRLAGARRCHP